MGKAVLKNCSIMEHISPSDYCASNKMHMTLNTRIATQYRQHFASLTSEDSVMDFGCGSGETTKAIAQGSLGNLGKPGFVLGVDISEEMIGHCRDHHQTPGDMDIHFEQLGESREDFISKYKSSFSLVTSFSCLHWVPDLPSLINMFNEVLVPGGKFVFSVCGSPSEQNPRKKLYEVMKKEPKWTEVAEKKFTVYGTIHKGDWMTTLDAQGYGEIIEEDLRRLMEDNNFTVAASTTFEEEAKLTPTFIQTVYETNFQKSLHEIRGKKKNEFINEYIRRVREESTKKGGLIHEMHDCIFICGSKK